jgi:DNA-directed RNA polymerase specialized sigma24 family protein
MTGSRPAAAQDSPEELVRRAAAGDTAAFARIVRLHNQGMTRVAYAITADPAVAVAATEAAWFSAWRGMRRKRTPEALGSWLCSLAATEAVDVARRRGDPGATTPGPEGRSPDAPSNDGLVSALARLDPEDRALLALRHVAGLSMAELSESVRRSRTPVAQRLARLNDDIGGRLSSGCDTTDLDRVVGQRLCAYADVPVRHVDADATARRARAEESLERTRVVSVAVSAVVGLLVAMHPYLARLVFGR